MLIPSFFEKSTSYEYICEAQIYFLFPGNFMNWRWILNWIKYKNNFLFYCWSEFNDKFEEETGDVVDEKQEDKNW